MAEAKGRQEQRQTDSSPYEDTCKISKQALREWLDQLRGAQTEEAKGETGQEHGNPAPRSFQEPFGQQPAAPAATLNDALTEHQRYYAKRGVNKMTETRPTPTNDDEVLEDYQRQQCSKKASRAQQVAPRVTWLGVSNPPISSPQEQQGVGQVDDGNHKDASCPESTQQSNLDGAQMFQAGAHKQQPATHYNHVLQEYQMQLMLLEQQNKKMLMMARQNQQSHDAGQEQQPAARTNHEL